MSSASVPPLPWLSSLAAHDLVESAQAAIQANVTRCFLMHRDAVYGYLVNSRCRAVDAEEVTQEVFLRLFRACERGDVIHNVRGWLFTTARNLAIDRSRYHGLKRLRRVPEQVWERLADTVPDGGPTSEERLLDKSRRDQLLEALDCLTELQRECVLLRAQGLLYREIADILDTGVRNVADAVCRGVTKLRLRLGE